MDAKEPPRSKGMEYFSSRLGLLLAAVGLAVGTGNIWRFPKVAAANGGAVFICLWLAFLFLWSIPLMTVESAIGRTTRYGTVGSFLRVAGPRKVWMGGFMAIAAAGIMCYYSVVTGWCLKFFLGTLTGAVTADTGTGYWSHFAGSWEAVWFHWAAAVVVGLIVLSGVRAGIERSAIIFVPVLSLILVFSALKALLLPGAMSGVNYLFQFNPEDFFKPQIYVEALAQSAWSTGAGWGLLLTYSAYAQPGERIVENSAIIGVVDSATSILAALAIIPTVFALMPVQEALRLVGETGESSTGLIFIWMPRLLGQGGGQAMIIFFFFALLIAALTSLVSLVELAVKNLIDIGFKRKTATLAAVTVMIIAGTPSALWSNVFDNQDWVWSLALLVCGLFFCIAVKKFGANRFRGEMINLEYNNDIRLGRGFDFIVLRLIPVQFTVLIVWWLYNSVSWHLDSWWNLFSKFGIGNLLIQWLLAVSLIVWLAPYIVGRLTENS